MSPPTASTFPYTAPQDAAEALARAEGDSERAPPGAVLMEVSWEVCNQMGGIYQVIRSKAPRMVSRWRNRYWLVGPYIESKAALDFEPRRPTGWISRVIDTLALQGLSVHHGRWLVPGRPRVLLLDPRTTPQALDALKYRVWEHHGIEFPVGQSDELVDGVVSFADAVRRLLTVVCDVWRHRPTRDPNRTERRVLGHFHEWLGGLAIPMLRRERVPIGAVFTTHATLLGRYLASSDEQFYEHLPFYDQAREAAHFAVKAQHGIERACAHGADVFTTVSQITGEECTHLLGRTPDLVLPNGLNIDRYNVGHEFQTMHAQFKDRIHTFCMGHFFPSYSFDLNKTLYVFTSGRFEPRNKGFDVCLEAMARLNAELKAADLGVTVVFFIVSQRGTRSINPQLLQRRGVLAELRDVCDHITSDLGEKLFKHAAAGKRVSLDRLVDEYWRLRYRRTQHAMRTDQAPPVITHVLHNEHDDPVLSQIRSLWITNRADDPVKVVYHPEFISPVSPLWGIEYEQFVRGCHLGIFPSAYEPWGYTPLECIAMGVPAITSDLAGFGRYVAETMPDHDQWGLTVLKRRGRSFGDAAADLARELLAFCRLDRRGRIRVRNEVERRAWEFDWNNLGRAYDWSHDLAMARAGAGV
jgi:glycogen(starch) synthase